MAIKDIVKACLQQNFHVPVHVGGQVSMHTCMLVISIVGYLPQLLSNLIAETPNLELTNPGSLAGE